MRDYIVELLLVYLKHCTGLGHIKDLFIDYGFHDEDPFRKTVLG